MQAVCPRACARRFIRDITDQNVSEEYRGINALFNLVDCHSGGKLREDIWDLQMRMYKEAMRRLDIRMEIAILLNRGRGDR